ncbi:phage portal protein [Cellulosimicrobium cellulans]|uniref:phage portal protein n=1 Tax=Cellulosimicrobium cellulans TaxID=1710 RepID=UPI0036628008
MLLRRLGIVTASATLPGTAGDVAQVADLPPGVAAAFGINVDSERVRREEAVTIPAVSRGEQVIAGTIAGFPLVCTRVAAGEDGRTAPTLPARQFVRRSLLEQPDPYLTASTWKYRLVADLVHEPHAWCRVPRSLPDGRPVRDANGFPFFLEHLDLRFLRIDTETQTVTYRGENVPLTDLVRFDSPTGGLLKRGAVVLRTALKLESAVRRYADIDVPLGVLRDESQATSGGRDKLTDAQVQKLLDQWESGSRKRVTRWIGRLKYEAVQFDAARIQLAQARERSDVAIAQLLNLESQQINAPSESGMTYTNKEQIAAERVVAVNPYMAAIVERLSMPDLTPRGQVVSFDTTRYVRGTTAEVINAAGVAVEKKLVTVDEARDRWLDLPPIEQTQETTDAA